MFYGQQDNEALLEQAILNEMKISNEDLKDPNILKKVLERSKKEAEDKRSSIYVAAMVLGIAADVVLFISTGLLLTSIGAFLPFIGGACALAIAVVNRLPDYEKKNVDKLEAKAKKLKEKADKMKDGPEKKQILSNCNKVLKTIENYRKKKVSDAEKAKYEENKKFVQYIINAIKGKVIPHSQLHELYGVYYVADKIGAGSSEDLDKGFTKYCLSHLDKSGIFTHITGKDNYKDALKGGFSEDDLKKYEKMIPGFKENTPFVDIGSNDEALFFFNQKNSSYYYGTYGFYKYWDYNKSLYSIVNKYSKEYKVSFTKEEIETYKQIYDSIYPVK